MSSSDIVTVGCFVVKVKPESKTHIERETDGERHLASRCRNLEGTRQ